MNSHMYVERVGVTKSLGTCFEITYIGLDARMNCLVSFELAIGWKAFTTSNVITFIGQGLIVIGDAANIIMDIGMFCEFSRTVC